MSPLRGSGSWRRMTQGWRPGLGDKSPLRGSVMDKGAHSLIADQLDPFRVDDEYIQGVIVLSVPDSRNL